MKMLGRDFGCLRCWFPTMGFDGLNWSHVTATSVLPVVRAQVATTLRLRWLTR